MTQILWEKDVDSGQDALEDGRLSDAERHFTSALEAMQRELGHQDPGLSVILEGLAKLYCAQRMYTRGRAFYRRLIRIKEKSFGGDHPEVAAARMSLAMIKKSKDAL